jgi:small GTP-binding protein
MDFDYLSKVILFGDDGVGKTTLETHLKPDFNPSDSMESAIGVNFQHLIMDIQGSKVKLQIWFMSNKTWFIKAPEFRSYVTGAQCAIFLYDITNASSLSMVPYWFKWLEERCNKIPILLVGNKVDDNQRRTVSKKSVTLLQEKYNLTSYMEISAKTGKNVKELFDLVGELIFNRVLRK